MSRSIRRWNKMCGLFGFLHYGKNDIKGLSGITNVLADESAARGTDAAGIAYRANGRLHITKDSKPGYSMEFKHPDSVKALIGHTRHSTQGSEKKNYNNHPFYGRCKNTGFALAHNGVIINDRELKTKYKLPKTKIETDSYVAVQLLEYKDKLDFASLKFMAEQVAGGFSFSLLDNRNNLWFVKGDSPICLLHFPQKQLYIYASTESILWRALIATSLFQELKYGKYKGVEIKDGTILRISSDGKMKTKKFAYTDYVGFKSCDWMDYGYYGSYGKSGYTDMLIDDLKAIACYHGYTAEDIDDMLSAGITPDEIEDYLYEM